LAAVLKRSETQEGLPRRIGGADQTNDSTHR
jgi:hypothetical protein